MKLHVVLLGVLLLAGCASHVHIVDLTGDGRRTPSGAELRFLRKVPPEYPPEVRKAGLQGHVQVQFIVQADGSISDLQIVRSANPVLDRLVLDAIAQWKFHPYTPREGKLEKVQFPITFELGE